MESQYLCADTYPLLAELWPDLTQRLLYRLDGYAATFDCFHLGIKHGNRGCILTCRSRSVTYLMVYKHQPCLVFLRLSHPCSHIGNGCTVDNILHFYIVDVEVIFSVVADFDATMRAVIFLDGVQDCRIVSAIRTSKVLYRGSRPSLQISL